MWLGAKWKLLSLLRNHAWSCNALISITLTKVVEGSRMISALFTTSLRTVPTYPRPPEVYVTTFHDVGLDGVKRGHFWRCLQTFRRDKKPFPMPWWTTRRFPSYEDYTPITSPINPRCFTIFRSALFGEENVKVGSGINSHVRHFQPSTYQYNTIHVFVI